MKLTQVQVAKEELLMVRDWADYQWVLFILRLLSGYKSCKGTLV